MGRMKMPSTSEYRDVFIKTKVDMRLSMTEDKIALLMPIFDKDKALTADITVRHSYQSMVIATPFKEDKKAFYYNQRLVHEGKRAGDLRRCQVNLDDMLAVLDWGGSVDIRQYLVWSSMSYYLDNKTPLGLIWVRLWDTSRQAKICFYNGRLISWIWWISAYRC